jgi:hypothetical protein
LLRLEGWDDGTATDSHRANCDGIQHTQSDSNIREVHVKKRKTITEGTSSKCGTWKFLCHTIRAITVQQAKSHRNPAPKTKSAANKSNQQPSIKTTQMEAEPEGQTTTLEGKNHLIKNIFLMMSPACQ